ncbi:MAG: hypothetical protein WD904_11420 [Dehalococcoidia bacterium]
MKKLWLLLLVLGATLLLAGAAACGGDDDDESDGGDATATAEVDETDAADDLDDYPTDDAGDDDGGDGDYYNDVADILNEADRKTIEISGTYGGPYDDDADEIDQTRSAFIETGQVLETVAVSLGDLDPPDEAAAAHASYIDTVVTLLQSLAPLTADLEDISTGAELDALQDQYGPELTAISDQQETACLALQDLADAASSGADLGCSTQE